ncbi:MAG: putative aminopeptidase FrvX [Candidatus Nanohaloarchaea archaeon]|jgi:putative aminopeptidase FrvX
MKQLLKKLVNTSGVSGNEHRIRETIRKEIADHADEIEEDNMGNLIARKNPEADKTLLLDAHMDQIGLAVRRIDEEGFLRISSVGGIYPVSVANQRVNIHTSEGEDIKGVIGMRPAHVVQGENQGLPDMNKIFVDIGAEDKQDVLDKGIRVGDYISYDTGFEELANDYVTGPALDNRVGCTLLIDAFKNFDESYEMIALFSSQEEIGGKGVKTSVFGLEPDVAVSLEVSQAGDVPHIDVDESDEYTGQGFGITMIEEGGRAITVPEPVRNWLIDTAEEKDYNYKRKLYDRGKTNAAQIRFLKEGIPAGVVVIPTRHIHSPVETVKMSDIEKTTEYVSDIFDTFPQYF